MTSPRTWFARRPNEWTSAKRLRGDHRGGRQDRGCTRSNFVANCFADPTGLLLPLVNEEMAWGDAGIALAILASDSRRGRDRRQAGTPEQVAEWAPQCFGQTGDIQLAPCACPRPMPGRT